MFESVESFCRPASVREALHLLQNGKGSARIVAGCTDVLIEGDRTVRCLIDVTNAGLNYIRRRGANWVIGATTTMAAIESSTPLQKVAGGLLVRAACTCGPLQIRNVATLGGNLAKGSSGSDLITPLLALDASVVIADAVGRRKVALAEYLTLARTRAMKNSLLVEAVFPEPQSPRRAFSFQKFGRTAVDIAIVNAVAGLELDVDNRVSWLRIALGCAAPTAIRVSSAEKLAVGRTFDQTLLSELCESVTRAVRPISDVRASADYRRELSRVVTGRALEECAASIGCTL